MLSTALRLGVLRRVTLWRAVCRGLTRPPACHASQIYGQRQWRSV